MHRHIVITLLLLMPLTGCTTLQRRKAEPYGKVYYLDGAGNLGFGQTSVAEGLRRAGFRGDVENFIWTTFTGPLTDQLLRINALGRSEILRESIIKYRKRYPNAPLHVIGLSAGTGVAVWAVQALPAGMSVDNMVLLGSSLSSNFDMTRCLHHVKDKVYVIYSPHDPVLNSFVPITGTIDGQYFVQSAGLVGLHPPSNASPETQDLYRQKVVNIAWRPGFEAYGYTGNHTDATNTRFVSGYIARLLGISRAGRPAESTARTAPTEPIALRSILLGNPTAFAPDRSPDELSRESSAGHLYSARRLQ